MSEQNFQFVIFPSHLGTRVSGHQEHFIDEPKWNLDQSKECEGPTTIWKREILNHGVEIFKKCILVLKKHFFYKVNFILKVT